MNQCHYSVYTYIYIYRVTEQKKLMYIISSLTWYSTDIDSATELTISDVGSDRTFSIDIHFYLSTRTSDVDCVVDVVTKGVGAIHKFRRCNGWIDPMQRG